MSNDIEKEAAGVYYDNFRDFMPQRIKDKISHEMLKNIFELMVLPAIRRTVRTMNKEEKSR